MTFQRDREAAAVEPGVASAEDFAPLSPPQRRIWITEQISPGRSAYVIPAAMRVSGPFDRRVFLRVLAEIVSRHEVLRSAVDESGDGPRQRIAVDLRIDCPHIDLLELPPGEQEMLIDRICGQWAETPFDLAHSPMLRAATVDFGGDRHAILLATHHLVIDGWSLQHLVLEIGTLYDAFARGAESPLPEPPLRFRDFAAWQIDQLDCGAWDGQLAYWEERLRDLPPALRLPASAESAGSGGATHWFTWNANLSERLLAGCRQHGCTPFVLLLAGVKLLLARYSGQSDIPVITPVSNRHYPGSESLIGPLSNDLVLRSRLPLETGFKAAIAVVKETVASALAHQDVPFDRVIGRIGAIRNAAANPFQVLFSFHQAQKGGFRLGELEIVVNAIAGRATRFDLGFEITFDGSGFTGFIEYDAEKFTVESIARMEGHLLTLLEAGLAAPETALARLPILTEAERDQFEGWNRTSRPYDRSRSLISLFEAQAARTPSATALVFEGQCLDYRTLNERAGRLARSLRARGVGRETLVGIMMERSFDMIVAVLATLKAGAAYVPLDPTYPDERLSYMAANSAIPLLLGQEHLRSRAPSGPEFVTLDAAALRDETDDMEVSEVMPDSLVYVIYTSGSTGRPKGAMNTDAAVRNRLEWMQEAYCLDETDRVLFKTPYSFDVSAWEIFWPLVAGAAMVIACPGGHQDTAYLADLIEREGVTTLHFVPSLLAVFVDEPALPRCGSLRRVICSGEALSNDLRRRFSARSSANLFNLYGPTEAAIDVSHWDCRAHPDCNLVPIGYPIANVTLHVLDTAQARVPVGVAGELYIGGLALARGYRAGPRETAARFVPDPFSETAGARLYRTGDLVRHLPDGALDYLGRNDHQLKIRGCRVELGEIESVLLAHAAIAQAVVLPRPDALGNDRLIAYVVPRAGQRLDADSLRLFAGQRLAAYMVPAAFVIVERFALAAHGKIDYSAFPAPDASDWASGGVHVPPAGPVQTALAQAFEAVLGREAVGIDDNFFSLGGNSISALRVIGAARRAGLGLSVQDLFRHPTVRGAALCCAGAGRADAIAAEPFALLSSVDRDRLPLEAVDAYPLTALQQGMIYHAEDAPDACYFHNVDSFRLGIDWDEEKFRAALDWLSQAHPVLRTVFDLARYDAPLQILLPFAEIPLTVVDLRAMAPEAKDGTLTQWADSEACTAFALDAAPLLRITVHLLDAESLSVGFTHHHAILDGWSLNALLLDLLVLYRGDSAQSPPETEAFENAMRDYAALERSAEASPEAAGFWDDYLDGAPVTAPISAIAPAEDEAPYFGERRAVTSAEVAIGLSDLARRLGVPMRSVLLSVHLRILAAIGGTDDVVTGVVTDARPDHIDPFRAIGLFLNTLLLRVSLGGRSREELIGEIFTHEQALMPFRRYPFASLQRRLGAAGTLLPLFNHIDFSEIRERRQESGVALEGGGSLVRTAGSIVVTFDTGRDDGIGIVLHYDRRLVRDDDAAALVNAYKDGLDLQARSPEGVSAAETASDESLRSLFRAGEASSSAPIFGETEEYVSPRGALEEAMSALWGDVLGLGRVSAVGNFFSLGGHSLTATRLVMRVRTVFSVELGLRSLFEASDLRSFCRLVAAAQGTASGGGGLRPLVPDPERRHEPFPLTPVQQAYWVGRDGAFELGRVAAHGYLEFELEDFDAARLEEALNVLIARHDMLRAVMLSDGRQRILASVERYRVALTDLSEVELVEREARLLAVREELSHQVLPVDRWPLFEVRASLLPEGRGRLHVSVDILIADGWSFQLLADELRRLYRDPSALAPVVASVLSFRDYVLVQEASRDGEEYRTARRYWEGRLADLPAAPQLPLARRAELVTTPRFERREGRLDAPAWQALKREASRHGLTASSVALCVYAETLGRYSRQARLTINLTLFNRPPVHEEIDRIVGDFTSTLLLSSEVGMGAFAERARRVQERLWEALDHRQMSGVEVLRELARQDGRGGRAAMPVVFTSALDLGEGGAEEAAEGFEAVYGLSQTPQVWLDLQVFEQRGGLRANLDAVEELFPFGLLDSLFGDYLSALSALAEDPRSWEAEPSAVPLSAWPDGPSAPLPDERLEAGFLRQAALDPSRAAVIHGESRICYGELERASRRLGREVRRLGGTRGELVGVLAPKGSGQVLAVLAVLRAGAAYLPLDPDLPGERLAGLVSDAGVRLVLTAPGLAPALPDGVARLTVTPAFEPLEDDGAALDLDEGAADDLAYVIYTSGSTGKPKGVSLTHRAALNTVEDINERYGVGPGDRVLALSSLSFDLSVYDLFGVLGAGGAVVVPEQARDPAGWLGSLRREEVTMWNSVPSSLQMLVDYAEARGEALPETLRLILLSGDWIPVDLASRLRRMLPGSELVSLGGATEAAIWSIYYPIHSVDPEWTSIPYGKALRNQRMMVLNEALEPCPMWVTGEIHIGGSGLALGYWRDPERSAERFIRHPRHGIWLYRTGDLGRLLPDGNIQFLGREDAQVKINGYRIELGEVEVALARWPGAREAAVVVRDGPGGKRMIGYVASPEPVEPAELRAFLATILPAYMIPARLIGTPDLPRTANGKLDRKALVTQDDACEPKPGNVAEPSVPLEEVLLEIWRQVLERPEAGPEANFFELGGNSVVAMQLIGQLQRIFGVQVSLADFFTAPTVIELTKLLRKSGGNEVDPAVEKIIPDLEGRHSPFPLTDIQEAYWVGRSSALELGGVGTHAYAEIDATGLDLDGFALAVRKVIDRHDMLRAIVQPDGYQRVLPAVPPFRIDHVDWRGQDLAEAARELDTLRRRMSHQLLPSDRWPLFQMVISHSPDGRRRLHISADTLIADAWSFQLAVAELFSHYESPDLVLPPLSVTFRDYVLAERKLRKTPLYGRARNYWRARVAALPGAPPLPMVSRPDGPAQFARRELQLPEPQWSALKEAAASRGITPSALLCSAYAEVLARWSGEDRFTLNVTVFNRLSLHEEINALVGDFTSTLLLDVDWSEADFATRAATLQRQLWRDLEHRIYSGVQMLRDIRHARGRGARALMPIVFTSTLGIGTADAGSEHELPWRGETLYGISQTPQVLLDHQASERGGALQVNWDFVEGAFPPGMMDAMFDAFQERIATISSGEGWTS